jgi:hypothetical protein
MTSPQDYRDNATDCLHAAAQSPNPADQQTMHDLARTWMCTALIAEQSVTPLREGEPAAESEAGARA